MLFPLVLFRLGFFTLIRLACGQPPSPIRGKARTLTVSQLRSSIDRRTDKPSPSRGKGRPTSIKRLLQRTQQRHLIKGFIQKPPCANDASLPDAVLLVQGGHHDHPRLRMLF